MRDSVRKKNPKMLISSIDVTASLHFFFVFWSIVLFFFKATSISDLDDSPDIKCYVGDTNILTHKYMEGNNFQFHKICLNFSKPPNQFGGF